MSPRLIDADRCPHCGKDLPDPVPRTCPSCMGSLQKRYLATGCLTSAPKLLFFAVVCGYALHVISG